MKKTQKTAMSTKVFKTSSKDTILSNLADFNELKIKKKPPFSMLKFYVNTIFLLFF